MIRSARRFSSGLENGEGLTKILVYAEEYGRIYGHFDVGECAES